MTAAAMTANAEEAERILASILTPDSDGARAPLYARLREIAPVHRIGHPLLAGWYAISGYENCRAVMTAKETVNNAAVLELMNVNDDGAFSTMNRRWMEYRDVAEHDLLKKLFSQYFTPSAMRALRPMIEETVAGLLDALPQSGTADVVAGFAFPLPALVIARILGIPLDDLPRFQKVMEDYLAASAMVKALTAEDRAQRDAMTAEFTGFFSEYLAARRREPREDLISKAGAAASAMGIGDDDLIAQFVFVLIAGNSTTADLIGNALIALDRHPDQRDLLLRGEAKMSDAINEFLRYETSLEVATRCFDQPMTVAGVDIPAGARALMLLHSAHHDPERFERPETLDVTRKAAQTAFPFGGGRYFCLGAPLAKLEAEIAIAAFLARYPAYRVSDLEWQGGLISHGAKRLVVELNDAD